MSTTYTTYTVTVTMEVTAPANAELSTNNISDIVSEHVWALGLDGEGVEVGSLSVVANECDCAECELTVWEVRYESFGHSVSVFVELPSGSSFSEVEEAAEEKLYELDDYELRYNVTSYHLAGIAIISTGAAAQ